MIKATINQETYQIKTNWEDVTVKDMSKAQNYISNMPKWLDNFIYSDKASEEPISDNKLLSFYIDWIELFSDIPREYLESELQVNNADEVSIVELFGMVSKFLGEPSKDDIGESEVIRLGKVDYRLIESTKSAGGIEKLLGGATYKHFAESQALATLFQKKQYRKWEYIAKITAILFRPDPNEMYNEETIDMRTNMFKSLPISELYKGYFFLQSHLNKLQELTILSLKEKREEALTAMRKQSLKTLIGSLKPLKWLKKVFSINKA